MKEVWILYKCDNWHSSDSMEPIFVGSSIEKCCWAAHWKGRATNQQVKELRESYYHQSQGECRNDFEFQVERWTVDAL